MHTVFAAPDASAIPVYLATEASWPNLAATLPDAVSAFAETMDFKAGAGTRVVVAGEAGAIAAVLYGVGDGQDRLAVAGLASNLPAGVYQIATHPDDWTIAHIATGWADGAYRFGRYLSTRYDPPKLVLPEGEALSRIAEAVDLVRDLVNTPAADMGPDAIESAIRAEAKTFGASVTATIGDELLTENYPMIHAVGRAATVPPRLVELSWGDESHAELAIVGKGVSFDSGGLNIKTGSYMRIMKKDMGGAAHAIGLARLVMGAGLPVRLKLYIPTVENAIAGNAFRPGDVLSTRKGKTVEIDNTDAEGRLILGDALTKASESSPDLIVDFATLTGAARVALGPDLAPVYTDDEALAADILESAAAVGDPSWRMPIWPAYQSMLKSSVADMVNSASSGMAGSITAALFLKNFVDAPRWVHLDVWAWREVKYGRPAGAAACGLRAIWGMLQKRYAKG
ncbi:MAG: leucyl aminopeptidase family protein [Pseudomonadota bacterium]